MLNVNHGLSTVKGLKVHVDEYLDTAKQLFSNKFVVGGITVASVSIATKAIARKVSTVNLIDFFPKVIGDLSKFELAGIPIGRTAFTWLGFAVGGLVVAELIRLGFAIREVQDGKGSVVQILIKEGISIIILASGLGFLCKIAGDIWQSVLAF
jgi:hypothetical protein